MNPPTPYGGPEPLKRRCARGGAYIGHIEFKNFTVGLDLLNELGAEGWELVSSDVTRSAVMETQGYSPAGVPIARDWTFKRPAP